MNRKKKITLILILVVMASILTIYLLNTKEEPTLKIIDGEKVQIVESDFIYNYPDSTSFPAVVRSSGKKPVETEYKGIELSQILSSLNVDISNIEKITLNAEDGYRVIISQEELNEPKNLYLVFERDGERLKTKRQNGNGPFQLVIRRDPFSQRWIKHVNEIIIE